MRSITASTPSLLGAHAFEAIFYLICSGGLGSTVHAPFSASVWIVQILAGNQATTAELTGYLETR